MTRNSDQYALMESTYEMCDWKVFEQEPVMSCRKASFSTERSKRICCWEGPVQRSRNCILRSKLQTSRDYSSDCRMAGTRRSDREEMCYRAANGNVLPSLARSCSAHRCFCSMNRRRP